MAKKIHIDEYLPSEINRYGDVKYIRLGWEVAPWNEARFAPTRLSIVIGWEGNRPNKKFIVPSSWRSTRQSYARR